MSGFEVSVLSDREKRPDQEKMMLCFLERVFDTIFTERDSVEEGGDEVLLNGGYLNGALEEQNKESMLKFFRRIRRKLLEEGNLRRYLVYAIGEILLVMVGILLALQVNNWNQSKANRTREIQLLKELKSDLIACESFLALGIAHNDFSIKAKGIVINFMEGKLPLNDTLQSYFNRFWVLNYTKLSNETAYKSIENWGFDNLSNDTLRQQIITLYNFQGKLLEEMLEVEKGFFLGDYLTTISALMDFEDHNRIQPFGEIPDVRKQQYINFEKLVKVSLQRNTNTRKRTAKEIERVKVNVEKEINRLEK